MSSRLILATAASALALAGSAVADSGAPPVKTADQAVATVKRLIVHETSRCAISWKRIDARGIPGDWNVTAIIRASKAGTGTARWKIGRSYPLAQNRLARAINHGCR